MNNLTMRLAIKLLITIISISLSSNSFAIGYPNPNIDHGNQGDFLVKRGTEFGRTANLTNIGPYIVNLPESPGSSGVGLSNGARPIGTIWDVSDLSNPVITHELDVEGQPIHAHATIVRFTDQGPALYARDNIGSNGDIGYNPNGNTADEQIEHLTGITMPDWPDIFQYSQMTSPFNVRTYWEYDQGREGVIAIHDPSRFMPLSSESNPYEYRQGPLPDLFGFDGVGVWLGVPYVYWDHFSLANVTGFTSFHGNLMVIASDQLSTGLAIYDVSGVRERRPPRLLSVFQPSLTDPLNNPIGLGGYWSEPYGATKIVFAARRRDPLPVRYFPAIYVVDFEDPRNPKLSCEIYLDPDPNDDTDGDLSSDPMYVNFQDNYAFLDHFRVDIEACETAFLAGNEIVDDLYDQIVYKFNDIDHGCDSSQYFRPLGQVGMFGGYDWWVTPDVNEQGMCNFVIYDEPDTRAPYVAGHRPLAGQTNYPIDGFIHIHIPETLRTETVEGAVTITNTSTNATVAYRSILSHTGTISIWPHAYLSANTIYRVDIAGVRDFTGNTMTPYSYTFTTDDGDLLKGDSAFPVMNYQNPTAPATIRIDSGDATPPDDTTPPDDNFDPSYSDVSYYPKQSSELSCQPNVYAGDIWTVNPDNDSVTIISRTINPTTMAINHTVKKEIRMQYESPTSISKVLSFYAVTYRQDDKVVIFNTNGEPLFSVDTGHGSQPIASVAEGDFLFVSLYGSGEIIKIDINRKIIVSRLEVGPHPKALALQNNRLLATRFISASTHGEVYDISTQDKMTLNRTILVNKVLVPDDLDHGSGIPNYLSSIVINAEGTLAYISAVKANIDRGMSSHSTMQQPLDSDNTIRPMLVTLDLVNNRDSNTNPSTRSGTVDFDNASDPTAVSFLPNPDVRVTALRGNDILLFQNLATNTAAQFDTNKAPVSMCSTLRTLYVKNFTSRSVSAIDISSYLHDGNLQQNTQHINTVSLEKLSDQELLGLQIFYHSSKPAMGPEGYMTCASCHSNGGHDGQVWDITSLGEGLRNTLSLNGASGTRFGNLHWSGNFDEVQDFELQMEALNGGDGLIPGKTFNGQSPLSLTTSGLSSNLDALAAYITGLGKDTVQRSPYKTYSGKLSDAAVRGKALFTSNTLGGAACSSCHSGKSFRDGNTHNVGTIKTTSGQRLGGTLNAIRTPTLIELWDSKPYFHDGSAQSLPEVLSTGEHNRSMSQSQLDDLIQYLLSIDREEYIDDT